MSAEAEAVLDALACTPLSWAWLTQVVQWAGGHSPVVTPGVREFVQVWRNAETGEYFGGVLFKEADLGQYKVTIIGAHGRHTIRVDANE